MNETFNPELFNDLFAENGLPECANCESQIEVLRTVEFIMQRHHATYNKLAKIEAAINLRQPKETL